MKEKHLLSYLSIFLILFGFILFVGCTVTVAPTPEQVQPGPPPSSSYPSRQSSQWEITGDATLYYDDLEPYGEWFWMTDYGWVWTPYDVPADWRPYTNGRWIYTDYGWTWESGYEWGWAPFHYGRWFFDSRYGWVWVPGREWAPAWVAWRAGGGYIGWAPLPPGSGWQVSVSIEESIRPHHWCFVEDRFFVDENLRGGIILSARNVSLFRRTQYVTNYAFIQNRIVNRSLSVEQVERLTGRHVDRLRVVEADSPKAIRGPRIRGDEFITYRPERRERKEGRRIEVPPSQRQSGPGERTYRPPSTTPPPQSQEILRRQEGERRRLESEQEKKRAALREEHRKELNRPPAGISRKELQKEHEAERSALEEQLKTEKKILEQRQEREQKGEIGPKGQKRDYREPQK